MRKIAGILKTPLVGLAAVLLALCFLAACAGTPLMEAAGRGDLSKVETLVQKGADLEDKGPLTGDWQTPLQLAAEKGHVQVVRYLLKKGADPNATGAYGANAVYLAAEYGHLECVKALAQGGADINRKSFYYRQALHGAAIGGNTKVIAYLLDQGAQINAKAYDGYTPLMLAARHGRADATRLLLARGADPNLKNDDGKTALKQAQERGKTAAVRALKEGDRLGIHYGDTSGKVGHHMSAGPVANCRGGGWHTAGFSHVSGSLPPGLDFAGSRLEGTPSQPGKWRLSVKFSGVSCRGNKYADEVVPLVVNIKGFAPRRVD
jgi:ankyrin repeat protein